MVFHLSASSSPTLHQATLISISRYHLSVTVIPQLEPLVPFYIFPSLPLTRIYRVCVYHFLWVGPETGLQYRQFLQKYLPVIR